MTAAFVFGLIAIYAVVLYLLYRSTHSTVRMIQRSEERKLVREVETYLDGLEDA